MVFQFFLDFFKYLKFFLNFRVVVHGSGVVVHFSEVVVHFSGVVVHFSGGGNLLFAVLFEKTKKNPAINRNPRAAVGGACAVGRAC